MKEQESPIPCSFRLHRSSCNGRQKTKALPATKLPKSNKNLEISIAGELPVLEKQSKLKLIVTIPKARDYRWPLKPEVSSSNLGPVKCAANDSPSRLRYFFERRIDDIDGQVNAKR